MPALETQPRGSTERFEQSSTPEYMVFHNLETVPYSSALATWPLHLTVVPPAEFLEANPERAILELIRDIAEDHVPFLVCPGERDMFGANQDRPGTKVLDHTGNLHALHDRLIWDLGSVGCHKMDGRWAHKNYSPHVADQYERRIRPQPFLVDSLTLARKKNGVKEVIETVGLVY